jgi:hypothetical protein
MDNSITIDGIVFTLLCKSVADSLMYEINKDTRSNDWDTHREAGLTYRDAGSKHMHKVYIRNVRDYVKFTSTTSTGVVKILYAYRSTSELGIWRLAFLERRFCMLNKFSLDYVQGTVLHHLLQGFINAKFESLDFISEHDAGTNLVLDRAINKDLTDEQIADESHRFILVNFSGPQETRDIDNPERKIELPPFSRFEIKCHTKTEEVNIKKQLAEVSFIIESEYEVDFASDTLFTEYPFQELNENIRNCIISIHTVNLHKIGSETRENDVVLVYCKYVMDYGEEPGTHASGYYGIALLKMTESEVNEYGLYSHFIDAGIYICKPVVYSKSCIEDETKKAKKKCSDTYTFVGDRYETIFPYHQLHTHHQLHSLSSSSEMSSSEMSSSQMRKSKKQRKSKKRRKSKKKRRSGRSRK